MYRLKKYQYLLYKHVLLHGLNVSVALSTIPSTTRLVLDPRFRLYWIGLNTGSNTILVKTVALLFPAYNTILSCSLLSQLSVSTRLLHTKNDTANGTWKHNAILNQGFMYSGESFYTAKQRCLWNRRGLKSGKKSIEEVVFARKSFDFTLTLTLTHTHNHVQRTRWSSSCKRW